LTASLSRYSTVSGGERSCAANMNKKLAGFMDFRRPCDPKACQSHAGSRCLPPRPTWKPRYIPCHIHRACDESVLASFHPGGWASPNSALEVKTQV
jgi:hypothetical protein